MACCALFIFSLVTLCLAAGTTTHKPVPPTTTPRPGELHHLGGHDFELLNLHRPGASLKFSLYGANLTAEPHHQFDYFWSFKLTDNSNIYIDRVPTWVPVQHPNDSVYQISWFGKHISLDREICFHYGHNNASWYSTYEEYAQAWPMDTKESIPKGRGFAPGLAGFSSVIENLFINSDGFGIIFDHLNAWFLRRDPNNGDPLLCGALDANRFPYQNPRKLDSFFMTVRIMAARNIREAHKAIIAEHGWIRKPKAIPDSQMFTKPIWSTWAQYHKDINQTSVLAFANEIHKRGFPASQIEIDDLWEKKYGDLTFDQTKFPNATAMVEAIHKLGYRATLWVYPFVNNDSSVYKESEPYLTKNKAGQVELVHWWDGWGGVVDFSNKSAANWFVTRLKKLQTETKMDSFKFDAGELNYYNKEVNFSDPQVRQFPSLITSKYVDACETFGGLVEVRSAFRTQAQPIFVRMLDKDSNWSLRNGLKSLITTALTMSLAGYSFILPDMIGGNAYGTKPSEELYIRWVQANTFLPAMQFSIPPWVYSESTVNLTKKFINLHIEHSPTILKLALDVQKGDPIIRPMWYAAPEDPRAFAIADQFMVGKSILVAPVVEEKQLARNVYLPAGTWVDQHGQTFTGPTVAKVLAPLEELPYFMKKF